MQTRLCWLLLIALLGAGTVRCAGGGDGSEDPDGSNDQHDGGGSDAGADDDAAECQTYADCPLIKDCRCNDGISSEGRACTDGRCAERDAFCVDHCADHDGWVPNPEGCWYWDLHPAAGTGQDYASARDGCLSEVRILVYRPGSLEDQNGYTWCIPQAQCGSDQDCPSAAESPTGTAFVCHPPVTGAQSGDTYRLCMDEDETLCNMR